MSSLITGVPVIDPTVRYVGVSKLRELKADRLRSLEQTLVIQDDEQPLAVILSYNQFLKMQEERDFIVEILESYSRKGGQLPQAIEEANTGKTTPLSRILGRPLKERKALNKFRDVEPNGINGRQNKAYRSSKE